MGCDGGTIPKRNEIVKNKQKDQSRDKDADLAAKWQFCSLSGLRLKKPIVSCQLGQLYNKDAIITHLLELKFSSSTTSKQPTSSTSSVAASHIKSLKDVRELKLKERDDFNNSYQATKGNERFKAQFLCPISGLELNGKYKFFYLLKCGCVLSERAIKQVAPDERKCLVCSRHYDSDNDLIVLNGDKDEVDQLREKMRERQRKMIAAKRLHKEKGEDTESTSRPKEIEHDVEVNSTSKRLKTKEAVR